MKTKRRLELFVFYDTEGIAAHLSRMAEKGWALQGINQYFWTYTQIPPEKRTYGIAFFPAASHFDPKPSKKQTEYLEYCEEARWHYVTQWHQMQIFYTTAENPVPLETDETLKLEIIHQAMKKSFLPGTWTLLALFAVQLFLQRRIFRQSPLEMLTDGVSQTGILITLLAILLCLFYIASYYRWRKKSLASTEAGGDCQKVGKVVSRIGLLAVVCVWGFLLCQFYFMAGQNLLGIAVVIFLLFVGIFWITFHMQNFLKKRGVSRQKNIILTVTVSILLALGVTAAIFCLISTEVFSTKKGGKVYTHTLPDGEVFSVTLEQDHLPLTTQDLTEIPEDAPYSNSCRKNTSFLASSAECKQLCFNPELDVPELEYTLCDIHIPSLTDWALESHMEYILEMRNRSRSYSSTSVYQPVSFADGIRAWQLYDGDTPKESMIMEKDNRIVQIHFYNMDVSTEQWEKAAEILFAEE